MQESDTNEPYSTDEMSDEREELDTLNLFAARLQIKAEECVAQKTQLEERWLEDMRNYYGVYDEKLDTNSSLFVNITRPKSVAAESRIADMLFPTDDRNFSIKPTPVPEIDNKVDSDEVLTMPGGVEAPESDLVQAVLDEANEKAKSMQDEIDDQLNECDYSVKGRDCIHDAIVLGTGILKGPVNTVRTQQSWQMMQDAGQEISVLVEQQEIKPETQLVDPWSFFPDMSARTMNECEFIFERHLLTRKQLRDLAKDKTFIAEQIANILKSEPVSTTATYIHNLRAINSDQNSSEFNRYEVWEYHGPIDKSDLLSAGADIDIDNTLEEINGVVFLCDGRVIKAITNPNETGEMPYDVFNWEEDATSVFGFGVPHLIKNAQRVVNASWRMMMDNAGLGVGPQIIMNDKLVEPAPIDGKISYEVTKSKVWLLKDPDRNVNEVFATHHIGGMQQELAQIFQLARELGDAETNLPMIAQGENNGPQQVQTATGMNLLMNSANIALKKAVKNFDDNVTRRHIKRYYDWNMQNSEKPQIKGDYSIDARGSSSLLVKETQAQNMASLVNIAQLPMFAPIINVPELLKMSINSMQIEADDLVKAGPEPGVDPQMQQQMQALQAANQQMQQELQSNQTELQIKQMQAEVEMAKLQSNEKIAVMKLRGDSGMKIQEIQAKMGMEQEKNQINRDTSILKAKIETAKEVTKRANQKMGFDSA